MSGARAHVRARPGSPPATRGIRTWPYSAVLALSVGAGLVSCGTFLAPAAYGWLGVAGAALWLVLVVGAPGMLAHRGLCLLGDALARERETAHAERMAAARLADLSAQRRRSQRELAHRAKTSLLAVEGGLRALQVADEQAPLLEAIRRELAQLRTMVAGDGEGELEAARQFDVRAELEPVVACFAVAGTDVDASALEPVQAWGRPLELAEVVQCLIENATRHAPGSPVSVGAAVVDDAVVEVWVADRGPGIPAELRGLVFERGFRAPGISAPGTGLGLYIARRMVEAQGGTITAQENHGGGTRMAVRLPRTEAAAARTPAVVHR